MRNQILALGCLFVLAACSGGGSGGGNGGGGLNPADFDLKAKPGNPAPSAYVNGAMATLKQSEQYIPEDAAFFSAIIDGEDVKYVYDGSAERNEAISKLHPVGTNFVNEIKANCQLNPARKTEQGQPKEGATVTKNLSLSSRGTNCGLLVEKSIENRTTYQSVKMNEREQTASIVALVSSTNKESREIKSSDVVGYSNVVSTSSSMNMTGTFKMNITRDSQTMDVQAAGTGSMKFKFANGHEIQGPVYTLVNMKSSSAPGGTNDRNSTTMEMRYKFVGTSPQGDVVIVMVMTNEGIQASLNGEPIDPNSVGGVKIAKMMATK